MASLVFDTHAFVKKLTNAGMPEAQAEAIVEAVQEAHSDRQPATRNLLDSHLETKVEAAKSDIIKWVAGLLIAQTALIVALLKLFIGA